MYSYIFSVKHNESVFYVKNTARQFICFHLFLRNDIVMLIFVFVWRHSSRCFLGALLECAPFLFVFNGFCYHARLCGLKKDIHIQGGSIMLIIGIILLLAGSGSLIYGITQNNSGSAQWKSLLSSGSTNPGTVFIVIGAIAAVVGLVLVIIGAMSYTQRQANAGSFSSSTNQRSSGPVLKEWVCPECHQSNSDFFNICRCGAQRPNLSGWRCPSCGKFNANAIPTCACGQDRPK